MNTKKFQNYEKKIVSWELNSAENLAFIAIMKKNNRIYYFDENGVLRSIVCSRSHKKEISRLKNIVVIDYKLPNANESDKYIFCAKIAPNKKLEDMFVELKIRCEYSSDGTVITQTKKDGTFGDIMGKLKKELTDNITLEDIGRLLLDFTYVRKQVDFDDFAQHINGIKAPKFRRNDGVVSYIVVDCVCCSDITMDWLWTHKQQIDAAVVDKISKNKRFQAIGVPMNFWKVGNCVLLQDKTLQYTFELKLDDCDSI